MLMDDVGESTFEIWLAPLELLAIELEDALVVSAPRETVGWVTRRFGRILDSAAGRVGRRLRVADELEWRAAATLTPIAATPPADVSAGKSGGRSADVPPDVSTGASSDSSVGRSVYPSSYTHVYNQLKGAS